MYFTQYIIAAMQNKISFLKALWFKYNTIQDVQKFYIKLLKRELGVPIAKNHVPQAFLQVFNIKHF